ncbi:MAG: glycoside hydrolase family 3 C-terminal domain-containing protein [Bacteroidales bacterium]|nr:glycoside hydrolase family 3 C-terminal domain-containing protein [Bacteroidales bacterium]
MLRQSALPKTFLATLLLALLSGPVICQTTYQYPFQNPELPAEERAYDLVTRLTLEEKVTQFFNHSAAIPRLGIPEYDWWNECLHGVARAGTATVFPQAIGLAATFNEDLMFRVATAISDEARAKHHNFLKNNVRSIYTGLTFWSPNINIFRDPRWGRGQETYGEDPYLTGRMAVQFIKGLQGDDPKYFKTIATAKHYAVHSGPEYTRHSDNFYVNDRDLYETYLPAFKAAVEEANVQSVMCAYNRFRDKPCCGSDILLSNILRNEFGFNGYIVSDCGAISDFYTKNAHRVVKTPAQAWGWAVSTGTDLNCEMPGSFLLSNLDSAIQAGIINEKDLNTSLQRLFKARFMLGMFDPDIMVPYSRIPFSVVGSAKHLELARESAEKSLVLLKNTGILPLRNVNKVALIGPNANNPDILIANYNGDPVVPVTPLTALRKRLGSANVLYSPGCPIVPNIYTHYEIVGFENLFHLDNGKLKKGLKAEYFEEANLVGSPKIVRADSMIHFKWKRSPLNGLLDDTFSVRWSGILIPKKTGDYLFGGNVRVKINGQPAGSQGITLEKGKRYDLEASFTVVPFWWNNGIEPAADLSWIDLSRDYRKEAIETARKADVIIFCGGISANLEGEEMPLETDGFSHGDRTHLNLPAPQTELLKELHKTGKPIVYVNFSGSAVSLNWEKENIPAIVQAFYPGEATGTALTRLLFGEFNPSGRLPVTFYKSVDDLPDFKDYRMEGRTYKYFKGEPLWEFGYGLSYSTFTYDNLKLSASSAAAGSEIKITVDVTNNGNMSGDEVVQVYVTDKEASVPVPLRTLATFKTITLKAGETKKVELTLSPDAFSLIDKNFRRVVEPGKFLVSIGGRQPGADALAAKSVIQTELNLIGEMFVIGR